MNIKTLKMSVKNKSLRIMFFVTFSLFISENVYTIKSWVKDFVDIEWDEKDQVVLITALIYDYKFGQGTEQGYLERCTFEASADGASYFKLMHLHTKRQFKSKTTILYLNNKTNKAKIQFLSNVDIPPAKTIWPEKVDVRVRLYNENDLAMLSLGWHLCNDFKDIRYIRINGRWTVYSPYSMFHFDNIVYELKIPGQSELKSNMHDLNVKVSKKDIIRYLKNQKLSL